MKYIIALLLLCSTCCAEVFFYSPEGVELLEPVKENGMSAPDYLLMNPGIYEFNGAQHDCMKEGLYRYYNVPLVNTQRIVYTGSIDVLMHSISWIQKHGYRDDIKSFHSLMALAKIRNIYMTCGSISLFTCNLLDMLGIENRFILFLTLEPWNGFNNGHSCVEIKRNGEWELWDIDSRTYMKVGGEIINSLQFRDVVQSDKYEIHVFSKSPKFACGDLKLKGYDYEFFYESALVDEKQMRGFYRKCVQVVLVKENGYFWFTSRLEDRARIESYSSDFRFMEESVWLNHFYPAL